MTQDAFTERRPREMGPSQVWPGLVGRPAGVGRHDFARRDHIGWRPWLPLLDMRRRAVARRGEGLRLRRPEDRPDVATHRRRSGGLQRGFGRASVSRGGRHGGQTMADLDPDVLGANVREAGGIGHLIAFRTKTDVNGTDDV